MPRIPDSDGLLHQGLKGEKPYLGAPATVDKILRGALKDVNDLRGRQLAGEDFDVVQSLKAIAVRLQDIFYGRTGDYERSFLNKPNVLGYMLVSQANMGGDTSDAVYRLIFHMINAYLTDYREFEDGAISDGEFQLRLQKTVTQYTHILTAGGRAL